MKQLLTIFVRYIKKTKDLGVFFEQSTSLTPLLHLKVTIIFTNLGRNDTFLHLSKPPTRVKVFFIY